jgi:hypothetical protein
MGCESAQSIPPPGVRQPEPPANYSQSAAPKGHLSRCPFREPCLCVSRIHNSEDAQPSTLSRRLFREPCRRAVTTLARSAFLSRRPSREPCASPSRTNSSSRNSPPPALLRGPPPHRFRSNSLSPTNAPPGASLSPCRSREPCNCLSRIHNSQDAQPSTVSRRRFREPCRHLSQRSLDQPSFRGVVSASLTHLRVQQILRRENSPPPALPRGPSPHRFPLQQPPPPNAPPGASLSRCRSREPSPRRLPQNDTIPSACSERETEGNTCDLRGWANRQPPTEDSK